MRWVNLLILVLLIVPMVTASSELFETKVGIEILDNTVYLTDENNVVRTYYIPNINYTRSDDFKIKFYRNVTDENLTEEIIKTQNLCTLTQDTCSEVVDNTTDRYEILKQLLTEQSDYIELYSDCSANLVSLNRSYEDISTTPEDLEICVQDLDYVTNQNDQCKDDRDYYSSNMSLSNIKLKDLEETSQNFKTQRIIFLVVGVIGGILVYRYFNNKKTVVGNKREGLDIAVRK